MLSRLAIRNFAIISSLDLAFTPGLNVLTGETGAGKSIILNAAHLLLGGRPSTDFIRTGEKEMKVEAVFLVPPSSLSEERGGAAGLESAELRVGRVILSEGPNKVFMGGKSATVATLQERMPHLMSIVSQFDHQTLLHREAHLDILDEYGDLIRRRMRYEERFLSLEELHRRQRNFLRNRARMAERRELLEFQLKELDNARIEAEEDDRLHEERERLRHAGLLFELAEGGYQRLYGEDRCLLDDLHGIGRDLEKIGSLDGSASSMKERFSTLLVDLQDVAVELRDYAEGIVVDPERLDQVEERLNRLEGLKKKYGPTLADVLRRMQDMRSELAGLEERDVGQGELAERIRAAEDDLAREALELSDLRREKADTLAGLVEEELRSLNMPHMVFRVDFGRFTPDDKDAVACGDVWLKPTGMDEVEFTMAPNPGEELRPLAKIASGGELSRILLAVKRILAGRASVETLIFDEVDAGIGGTTAELVGRKLLEISSYHQVLCITHLPQIACYADHHFKVYKELREGRAVTCVQELGEEHRIAEIARMLGGGEDDGAARDYARKMIERLRNAAR